MLESIFIMLFVSGIVTTLFAIDRWEEDGDLALWGISFVIFIVLFAQSIYIEVPWIASSSATNYTTGNQQHIEMSVMAICLGIVIIDVIAIFLSLVAWRDKKKGIALP